MTAFVVKDSFDTARMTAFCRAQESERKHGCIHDPYARQLAGLRGEEIVCALGGRTAAWPIVVRTYVYDEIIMRLANQQEIDTVINLAAGLDTRPYRLELPDSLTWVEVDLPDVLAYKQGQLAQEKAVCNLERIALDITDDPARQRFLTDVCKPTKRALVLTEGLLTYLTTEKVAAIAADMSQQKLIRWWLTELIPRGALAHDDKRWNTIVAEEAQTHFAPPGGLEFFQLLGWHLVEFRSVIREGLHLKQPVPNAWLLRLLARIAIEIPVEDQYNMGGFILLEQAD